MIHTSTATTKNVVAGTFGATRPAKRTTLRTWEPSSNTIQRVDRARQALTDQKRASANWDSPVDWSETDAVAETAPVTPTAAAQTTEVIKVDFQNVAPKATLRKPLQRLAAAPAPVVIDLSEPLVDLRERPTTIVLAEPTLPRIWPTN